MHIRGLLQLQMETLSHGTVDLFVVEELVYQKKKCSMAVGGGSVGKFICRANVRAGA